ncbi:hypothetical protein [Chroococcidiopsis sp.]|uniref:hypothetical protein n=1 Tax=Chroococcidiopsis sp. TaxID=3088168 RepID=UPI003F2D7602
MASYCQDSSCGTVNYRPYVGGKIRWRYGTEPWQEIIGTGLTYTTKVSNDLIGTGSFKIITQLAVRGNGSSFVGWQSPTTSACSFIYPSIDDYCLILPVLSGNCMPNNEWGIWMLPPNQRRDWGCQIKIWANGTTYLHSIGLSQGFKIIDFVPCDPAKQKTKCEFKIFAQNGTQIRTETRATCPEVQVLPAGLATDTKSLKIQKSKDLERIEVNNIGYANGQNFNIPPECLNIYTTGITTDFKAQICSDPGTPPPQYEVVCCAPCESCPAGTCAIECGNQICCYGSDGISVKSINLANYCPS